MIDKALEHLFSLEKSCRESVAKQMIFDCAMELEYRYSGISDDVLANKLMNALQALDKED